MLGIAKIRRDKDGIFEFSEEGVKAIITPCGVYDPSHECIWDEFHDLVAFEPSQPKNWWLRDGSGVVLGQPEIDCRRLRGIPIRFVSTPLDYLRAGCKAACLVGNVSLGCEELLGLRITCSDIKLAAHLHLTALRSANALMPNIVVED